MDGDCRPFGAAPNDCWSKNGVSGGNASGASKLAQGLSAAISADGNRLQDHPCPLREAAIASQANMCKKLDMNFAKAMSGNK